MSRAYRVISPNIHEYISYITWIPKYAKDVITRDPAFFVHKTKNGDRGGGPRKGESLCKERKRVAYIYIYIFTKKICHVMRRGLWNEDDQNAVNRRRGGKKRGKKRQRQMQESRKRSSCTPCTQLSSLSFSLSLSFSHCVVDSCVPILRVYIPLSATNLFAAPFRHKETIRVTKYLDPCTLREGRDFLIERLRETLNFECACCEIVRGKF